MTSQKSSINPFAFTYRHTLKTCFTMPVILAGFLSFMVAVIPAIALGDSGYANTDSLGGMSSVYKYMINENDPFMLVLMHIAVVASCVCLGIQAFRFIASKKAVNVYYSLGISRTKLFTARYLGGITLIAASVFAAFFASFIVNVVLIGFSRELLTASLFHFISYTALGFTVFSLTAFVFSGVGTVAEGIIYTLVFLAVPTIIIYCIEALINKFTLGAAFGVFYDPVSGTSNSLVSKLIFASPAAFAFKGLLEVGTHRSNPDGVFEELDFNFIPAVGWLAICAVIFFAGMYVFKRRRAEICGFLGMCRPMSAVAMFSIEFYFMVLLGTQISPTALGFVIGVAVFALIFALADLALSRSLRRLGRDLKKLPLHLGAAFVIVLVFCTGFFGFESRIPDVADIESVDVGGAYNSKFLSSGYYDYIASGSVFTQSVGGVLEGCVSDGDIQKATLLHKTFVEAGKLSPTRGSEKIGDETIDTDIRFVYHLKNGDTMYRRYSLATLDMLEKALVVDDTDRCRELTQNAFNQSLISEESYSYSFDPREIIQSKTRRSGFSSPLMDSVVWKDLSDEQNRELDDALLLDLKEQSVEEKFFPKTNPLGIIYLADGNSEGDMYYYADDGVSYTSPSPPVTEAATASDIELPAESFKFFVQSDIRLSERYPYLSFIIDGSMRHTVAFLEKHGLMPLFEAEKSIVKAQLLDISPDALRALGDKLGDRSSLGRVMSNGYLKSASQYITSRSYDSIVAEYEYSNFFMDSKDEYGEIVAPEKLAALYSSAYSGYFNSRGGYAVSFTLDDGRSTTMYIPADEMPEGIL